MSDSISIIKQGLVYNYAIEDTVVDRKLLGIGVQDTILILTSGGDAVLSLLLDNPRVIYSVDMNPVQNYLLEFKMACMRKYSHAEYFKIFNNGNEKLFLRGKEEVFSYLSSRAREYWSDGEAERAISNFRYYGTMGKCTRIVRRIVPKLLLQLLDQPDLESQRHFYMKNRNAIRKSVSNRMLFVKVFEKYFLRCWGVPYTQLQRGLSLQEFFLSFLEYHAYNIHAKSNPFCRLWLGERMDSDVCFDYMREENFNVIKSRLDRVVIRYGDLISVLKSLPDQEISKWILLDHMDWLSPDAIQEEFSEVQRVSKKEHAILWRSYTNQLPAPFMEGLKYEVRLDVHKDPDILKDRYGSYRGTFVASIPEDVFFPLKRKEWRTISYIKGLKQFLSFFKPVKKKGNVEFLNSFYEGTMDSYDEYREKMLPVRTYLCHYYMWKKNSSWLDVGCGTGFLFECLESYLEDFSIVEGVEPCVPMLECLKKKSINEKVRLHSTSISSFYPDRKYDLVTLSYVLSMFAEEEWKTNVDHILKLLSEHSGTLIVMDFLGYDNLMDNILKASFSKKRVYIGKERFDYLKRKLRCNFFDTFRFRLPYTPFYMNHYIASLTLC